MSLQRQVAAKIAGKRDPTKDAEAQAWIEEILGWKFPAGQSYEDTLKDGVVICKLINKIKPGSVAKINETGATFKLMENVQNFQKALKAYGVPDIDVFQTVDLFEKKDIGTVTNTFFALGRAVWKDPNWKGPKLGPKPADLNEREFTDEQLAAGQTIIGLQAGQNKGATQAGQNIGAGRKILLGK